MVSHRWHGRASLCPFKEGFRNFQQSLGLNPRVGDLPCAYQCLTTVSTDDGRLENLWPYGAPRRTDCWN